MTVVIDARIAVARRRSIAVFCGARLGSDPAFTGLARAAGQAIAERGWDLVYGGGAVGLMGEVAHAALAAGGRVLGVIPESLMRREVGHTGLTRLEVVADMAIRKTRMLAVADGFLTLPGGFGTLDELFEVVTLRQIGQHAKPIVLCDPGGYWKPMLAACQGLVAAGLANAVDLAAIQSVISVPTALDLLGDAPLAGDDPFPTGEGQRECNGQGPGPGDLERGRDAVAVR